MKWLKIMFYCFHSFARKHDSYKGSVYYASFMSALSFLMLLMNGAMFIDLMFLERSGPLHTIPSKLFGVISLGVAFTTYIIIRTNGRYDRILKAVDAYGLSKKQLLKAKILSVVVLIVLFTSMSVMAFMLAPD